MTWRWDWQHSVIVLAAIGSVTAIVLAGKSDALVAIFSALGGATTLLALAKRSPMDRGVARVRAMESIALGSLVFFLGCAWWRTNAPVVADAAEEVIHVADGGCNVVSHFVDDATVEAICVVLHDVDRHLAVLDDAAKREAPAAFVVEAPDQKRRRVVIPRHHVRAAHASARAARGPSAAP